MWKPFSVSDNLYLIHLEEDENQLTVILTDLVFIWESQISTEMLVHNFKENNPIITASADQIKKDLVDATQNLQNLKVSVNKLEDCSLELILEQNCERLSQYVKEQSIVYKFVLTKKDQNEFKDKVTVPAIQTIYYLEKQQKMLLNLLQKKDRELEEYRMEKGDISRGDLKTENFNSNLMNTSNNQLFLNVFATKDSEDFWKKFAEENGEVETSTLNIELEPWNARPRKRVIHSSQNVVKKGSGIKYKK